MNWGPFAIPPQTIDTVCLTHAHTDHTTWLPRQIRNGFASDIFCTAATHGLCKIILADSAHIQMGDARWGNKKGFSKHKPALSLYKMVKDADDALKHPIACSQAHPDAALHDPTASRTGQSTDATDFCRLTDCVQRDRGVQKNTRAATIYARRQRNYKKKRFLPLTRQSVVELGYDSIGINDVTGLL